MLILTRPGADSAALGEAVRTLGNVTLLERPVACGDASERGPDRHPRTRAPVSDPRHLAERARAEESLRVADQRKDEFLATLGHELRNPLAPLLTGLELLKTAARQGSRRPCASAP